MAESFSGSDNEINAAFKMKPPPEASKTDMPVSPVSVAEQKTDLKNLAMDELVDWLAGFGLKPFRARQIFSWIYRPEFSDFSQMTDIAKHVRAMLAQKAWVSSLKLHQAQSSTDGTAKLAFMLDDGHLVESVLIPEKGRYTLCVSSQVGCAMGCRFCLTGQMGFKRNLSAAEIVGQVDGASSWLTAKSRQAKEEEKENTTDSSNKKNRPIDNIVFMGMGEPLLNFDNLVRAINILMSQFGHDFSGRRITVSTCGIIPAMRELGLKLPVNMAVSLHSADDGIREELMPINRRYPLDPLLDACRNYPLPPRRRIMIEYVIIRGVNDSLADARLLVKKLHGIRCKINILPFNESPGLSYKRAEDEQIEKFRQVLRKAGYTTLLRNSRGAEISAACGQLAV